MKKFFKYAALLLGLLIVVLLIRTFIFSSKQVEISNRAGLPPISDDAVSRLGEAIRFATISHEDPGMMDTAVFKGYLKFLADRFPLTDSLLEKETINTYSLLYTWKGSEDSLKPLILIAHMDVVPDGEENANGWEVPAFSGLVKDGMIWGRGSLDDKVSVMGILESVEMLLKSGFKPRRTVILGFGHDEEIGGQEGAVKIVEHLKKKNIKAEFLVDEGMVLTKGVVPGIDKTVALIGIAEKGFLSLQLSVDYAGGHSSMPGRETAISILARAINKLQEHPFDADFSEPVDLFLDHVGPEMPFMQRMAFANRWLFKGMIIKKYEASNSGNATIRTTMAPTIFKGGVKDNVLPSKATAVINFRILPGESIASVMEYVSRIINDERVKMTASNFANEPSPVSNIHGFGFSTLITTTKEVFGNEVITTPSLMIGASDSRHYTPVCDNIYRFLPVTFTSEDLERIHGKNERIAVSDYKKVIAFYWQLIRNVNLP